VVVEPDGDALPIAALMRSATRGHCGLTHLVVLIGP